MRLLFEVTDMPIPAYDFEDPGAGLPPKAVPVRFACLAADWSPRHFVQVVLGRMAETNSLIQVFKCESKAQHVGEVRWAIYEQYERELAELRERPLSEQLALFPVDHFVWSDDLVRAFSDDIDLTIGREVARAFDLRIVWQPALGDCTAVIEECVDLSSVTPKGVDKGAIDGKENTIEIRGEIWTINFGGASVPLKHRKGLEYIKVLLQTPNKDVSIHDLHSIVNVPAVDREEAKLKLKELEYNAESQSEELQYDADSQSGVSIGGLGDAGPVTDERSIKEYKARLKELPELIEDANARGDTKKQTELEGQQDWLINYLATVLNIKGKPRKDVDSDDKLRKAILRAITLARIEIQKRHPGLADHFKQNIETGSKCRYRPPEGVRWRIIRSQ